MGTASKNLLLASLSTLAAFAAVEGYLHLAHGRWASRASTVPATTKSSNPVLLWEYRPGSVREYRHRDQAYSENPIARFNRFGFRDRDDAPGDASSDEYRVAFIGDSATEGLGVTAEDTFVRKFESDLNTRMPGQRVRALNFGIGGYNTLQIEELLSIRVIAFEPDAVVYAFHLNDFDFEDASGQLISYYSKPPRFLLWRLVEQTLSRIASRDTDYYHRHFAKNEGAVFESLHRMGALLADHDIHFLVAVLPIFRAPSQPSNGSPPPAPDIDIVDPSTRDISEAVVGFLDASSIPLVDLAEIFDERGPSNVALGDWHPNARGHAVIARALAAATLARLGLDPATAP